MKPAVISEQDRTRQACMKSNDSGYGESRHRRGEANDAKEDDTFDTLRMVSGCRAARHAVASRTRRGALPSSAAMKMRRRAQRRPYTFSGKRVSCVRRIRIAQGRLLGCKTTPAAHCTTKAACHPCQPEPRRPALRATRHAERYNPAVLYRHIYSRSVQRSGAEQLRGWSGLECTFR